MIFKMNDLVMTPQGEGIVMYVRMAPPDYSEPQAYSVSIGSHRGTIFLAEQVEAIPGRSYE